MLMLIGVGVGWESCSRRDKAPPPAKVAAQKRRLPQPRLAAPVPLPKKVAQSPVECEAFWGALQNVGIAELDELPERLLDLPRTGRCVRVPGELKFWHEKYRRTCERLSPETIVAGSEKAAIDECFVTVATYRAYVSDWMTRAEPLSHIEDPRLLADKLMVAYLSPGGKPNSRGLTRMGEVALRLLERDPRSTSAAKAFLSAMADEGTRRWSERIWRRAEQAVELAEADDPEGAGIQQVALWVRSRGAEARDVPGSALQKLGGFSFLDFYSR
jgi:hypothetical protein